LFIFILESLGTQELILIGIIALVVLGPRKLPEMARKLGSLMSDFRRVSGDFRSTWENAVDFEADDSPKKIENTVEKTEKLVSENTIGKIEPDSSSQASNGSSKPEVKEMTKEEFDEVVKQKSAVDEVSESEKTNWL